MNCVYALTFWSATHSKKLRQEYVHCATLAFLLKSLNRSRFESRIFTCLQIHMLSLTFSSGQKRDGSLTGCHSMAVCHDTIASSGEDSCSPTSCSHLPMVLALTGWLMKGITARLMSTSMAVGSVSYSKRPIYVTCVAVRHSYHTMPNLPTKCHFSRLIPSGFYLFF